MSKLDPLPSERKLSAKFGVGRTVLRGALQQLSDEGLLARQGRRGLVVMGDQAASRGWLSQAVAFLDPMFDARSVGPRDAYWANYVSLGVGQAIRDAGRHVVSLNARGLGPADIKRLAQDQPAGVIVPEVFTGGPETLQLVQLLISHGVRVVVYGGHEELGLFDRVTSDHSAGAYQLTSHLIARHGCQRIVELWPKPATGYWYPQRHAGYERAMNEASLEPLPPIEADPQPLLEAATTAGDSRALFQAATRNLAGYLVEAMVGPRPVDAIMVGSDRDAFALAAACRLFGRTPGKDIFIAGYDNYWERSPERSFEPTPLVATVDKQNDRLGEELVKLLLDRVEGRLPAGPQCRKLSPKLVVPNVA